MFKKKKKKNIYIYIISIVVIIILILLSFSLNRNYLIIEKPFKDISTHINKLLIEPITLFSKEKGIDQTKSYLIQKNKNESLEKEIEELKKELELNKTLTGYKVVNATITSRNKSYWFNTISIDKGSKAGIKKDQAVVTSNGLIGKISKVSFYSSEVKLLTSDDINFKVSISIKVNGEDNFAILNGYDNKKKQFILRGIDKNANISVGNEVLTSGLGGVFPSGIYIGKVENIVNDKYDLSKTAYIKSNQDFNNIHYVTVLKESN